MRRNEIEKRVYERYPVTKKERECADEKKKMDEIRKIFKKRLIEQTKEKKEY